MILDDLLQKYHSMRVLTLVYQPFALGTLAILTYHEANINTRKRNLFGYILFFFSTLAVLLVSPQKCLKIFWKINNEVIPFVSCIVVGFSNIW